MSPHLKEAEESGVGITFSKVKYRIQNMLPEVRMLKLKEQSARMEAEALVQKLRSLETEHNKTKASLEAQIAESVEARQKLENTVKIMGIELATMENKVKGSKMELKAVLESRSNVIDELKISKYQLERKVKNVTSELTIAMGKLSRNTVLFEAVELEASSVNRLLDETRQLVSSREATVSKLQKEVAWMTETQQKLLDKARASESDLENKQTSLSENHKEILTLKQMLERAQNDCSSQTKLTLAQKAVEAKEKVISQLNVDKQNLIIETETLKAVIRRFQAGATEQDIALGIIRECLVSLQQSVEKRNREAEERLHMLEEKGRLLAEHLQHIRRPATAHEFHTNEENTDGKAICSPKLYEDGPACELTKMEAGSQQFHEAPPAVCDKQEDQKLEETRRSPQGREEILPTDKDEGASLEVPLAEGNDQQPVEDLAMAGSLEVKEVAITVAPPEEENAEHGSEEENLALSDAHAPDSPAKKRIRTNLHQEARD